MQPGEVRSHVKPEFLNRFDDILVFHRLTKEELRRIVDVQLVRVAERFAQRDLSLEVTVAARDWLADRGFDPVYGARPLKRVLRRELEDRAALLLLDGKVEEGQNLHVDAAGDDLVITGGGGDVGKAA